MTLEPLAQDFVRSMVLRDLEASVASETVPAVTSAILGFLRGGSQGGMTFVFPCTGPSSIVVAALHALCLARGDFELAMRRNDDVPFKSGQLVHLSPEGWTYEFAGLLDHTRMRFIQLRVPAGPARGELHSIKAEEAFRLHRVSAVGSTPAKRVRPGSSGGSTLDQLLGTRTGGNMGVLPTRVLLVTARGEARTFIDSVGVFRREDESRGGSLADLLTWGRVTASGELESEDRRTGGKPPAIAVSHSLDAVAAALRAGRCRDAVVIIDGLAAVRNLQALDEVVASRRCAVICDQTDREALEQVAARIGCWPFSPSEVLADTKNEGPVFGTVLRAAANARDFRMTSIETRDERIDRASSAVATARSAAAAEPDQTDDLRTIIGRTYRLLMRTASWLCPPSADTAKSFSTEITELEHLLHQSSHWLRPETVNAFEDALVLLLEAAQSHDVGRPKAAALETVLRGGAGNTVVAARHAADVREIEAVLQGADISIPVLSINEVGHEEPWQRVVITSWPTRPVIERLVSGFCASEYVFVGYRFEQDWLGGFRSRWERGAPATVTTAEQKAAITGYGGWTEEARPPRTIATQDEDPLTQIVGWASGHRKGMAAQVVPEADSREARYVSFAGRGYCYLTSGRELPVVTDVVSGRAGKVPFRTVDALAEGDYLLFREHGGGDMIAVIAEHIAGAGEYRRVRDLASGWRRPLRSLGDTASGIYRKLWDAGIRKSRAAVRGWILNDERIGPGDRDDLRIIAEAAGDAWLAANAEDVWSAMTDIRSLHIQAGHRLSELLLHELPGKVRTLADTEMHVDLTFGSGWIVRVEQISADFQLRHHSEVNCLLWDEGI